MQFLSRRLLWGAPAAAVLATMAIAANSAAAQSTDNSSADKAESVVVSGTRIVRDGYSAPTPVTVVTQEQLGTSVTGNIADYVNTMPAFFGSSTPESGAHSSSNAQAGLNILNLRNIGGVRTLVLIDGQRSVGATTTGLVDINNIPQDLVTRVDVVTGGASAAYGSDALAGVVNFVLDRTYEGVKGEISGGLTSYGDDYNYRVRLTAGLGFDGDRGHFIFSGELTDDNGVKGVPRAWNNQGWALIPNPTYAAGNGQPQFLNVNHAFTYAATFGGVIVGGPLGGTAFGPGGIQRKLNFGSITSNPWTVGGDWQAYQANNTPNLDPSQVNNRIFTRLSYAITPDITVFGQYSWASAHAIGANEPNFFVGNLTIKADNAFIPAAIKAAVPAGGLTFGTYNQDAGIWTNNSNRTTVRYVVGADGKFGAMGSDWTWNAYFQEGKTFAYFQESNLVNKTRYNLAIDAVSNANGQIICRDTIANPNDGCVPFNLFGTGVNTQAAVNYIEPGIGPWQRLSMDEQVWSGSLNGEPFSTWAGPVSIAAGAEHRRESVGVTSDQFNGQWYAANYTPVRGAYSVNEGFVETVVPLARDAWFAKAIDINAAVRATSYSTAGFVTTWKIGATWDVTPDIRIRGTRSRDIRAPNLSELYQTGAGGTGTVLNRFVAGTPQIGDISVTTGNPLLKPETSDGTGLGVVLQPSFIPHLNLSVDYWEMDIKKIIGNAGMQGTVDLCFQGFSIYCALISPDLRTNPNVLQITIFNAPANLSSETAEGIDFEGDYHVDLADLVSSWSGSIGLHWVGTHYITNTTNNGLTPPVQVVGAQQPKWRNNLTLSYTRNSFTFSTTGRFMSSGVQNNNWVQCASSCSTSTTNNPTISNDYQSGALYIDTALGFDFEGPYSSQDQLFFNIQNIMNRSPAIVTQGLSGSPYVTLQTTPVLYDVLGRTYRLGLRFNL